MIAIRRMSLLSLGAFALLPTLSAAPAMAAGAATAPHRVAYVFRMDSARLDSGIVDIKGGMTYEIADSCDGWTVNQKIFMQLFSRQNRSFRTVTTYSSWESKDGLRFRFSTNTSRNGRVTERFRGSATLKADGSGGEVSFTVPKTKTMKLAAGTIFPTKHSELVMSTAAKGERFVWRTLFDGTTDKGPYGVSAVMSKPKTPKGEGDAKIDKLLGKLGGERFWSIKLAFFPENTKTPQPDYELAVGMHANSVIRWLKMDYGQFVIDARLARIEPLPKAKC